MARKRRHHNNVARRSTLRGKREREVERMAKRIFGKKIRKISNTIFVKERFNVSSRFLDKSSDIEDNKSSVSDQN
jgi:hypothetical protein